MLKAETDEPKCDVYQQNDELNTDRMVECSSLTVCYDSPHNQYSDSLCPAEEKCGVWNITNSWYDGCLLAQYCNLNGTFEGSDVWFRCLNGDQSDHGRDRYAIIFDLQTMYEPQQYQKSFLVTNATDILIEGTEKKVGY